MNSVVPQSNHQTTCEIVMRDLFSYKILCSDSQRYALHCDIQKMSYIKNPWSINSPLN